MINASIENVLVWIFESIEIICMIKRYSLSFFQLGFIVWKIIFVEYDMIYIRVRNY